MLLMVLNAAGSVIKSQLFFSAHFAHLFTTIEFSVQLSITPLLSNRVTKNLSVSIFPIESVCFCVVIERG